MKKNELTGYVNVYDELDDSTLHRPEYFAVYFEQGQPLETGILDGLVGNPVAVMKHRDGKLLMDTLQIENQPFNKAQLEELMKELGMPSIQIGDEEYKLNTFNFTQLNQLDLEDNIKQVLRQIGKKAGLDSSAINHLEEKQTYNEIKTFIKEYHEMLPELKDYNKIADHFGFETIKENTSRARQLTNQDGKIEPFWWKALISNIGDTLMGFDKSSKAQATYNPDEVINIIEQGIKEKRAKEVIITDGMDNDGRVSALLLKKYLEDSSRKLLEENPLIKDKSKIDNYVVKPQIIYLSRSKKVMDKPVWEGKDFKELGELKIDALKDKTVRFTDIKYDFDIMQKIADEATGLIVYDHHEPNKKEDAPKFKEAVWYKGDFGESKKASVMFVKENIQPLYHKQISQLPELVSDRDTFAKTMIESEYVFMALNDFNDDEVLEALEEGSPKLDEILTLGEEKFREYQKKVDELIEKEVKLKKWGDKIILYTENIPPQYLSDVDFYVNVSPDRNNPNQLNFGLRSLNAQALPIAHKYGGGGHKDACGFQSKTNPFKYAKDLSQKQSQTAKLKM